MNLFAWSHLLAHLCLDFYRQQRFLGTPSSSVENGTISYNFHSISHSSSPIMGRLHLCFYRRELSGWFRMMTYWLILIDECWCRIILYYMHIIFNCSQTCWWLTCPEIAWIMNQVENLQTWLSAPQVYCEPEALYIRLYIYISISLKYLQTTYYMDNFWT